ncbi:LLM class flavin-dependent oxidoreductase [Peribacillus sp. SCS-155]|uniref:LLM class flavin-dependent oxidoreductase n=1 Tax=Peribacillus sedimenti TaxID=3115297 RepID=UPI0039066BB4
MQLSVLDQSPISRGATSRIALKQTVRLAKITEELGYTRFWVAEHHNTNGLASSSPEVLLSHIASHTKSIRVGSGGILLPQYSPYKVAENFQTLEALFPGRVDLGVGRSPGGSPVTRLALTDGNIRSLNEFPRQLRDLQGFVNGSLPKDHPYYQVRPTPITEEKPEMWLLGISHRGARLAAEIGTAFTYGHFISPADGQRASELYFSSFRPSVSLKEPKMNVCIFVICADSQEEAERLAMSQDRWLLNVEKGLDTKIPSIEEAENATMNESDREKILHNRKRAIVGTPEKVKQELELLQEIYQTDEFMIITNVHDFDAKVHSYELLAETLLK